MFNLQAVKSSVKNGKLILEIDLSSAKNPENLPLTKSGKSYQIVNSGLVTLENGLMFSVGVFSPKTPAINTTNDTKKDNTKKDNNNNNNVINSNNSDEIINMLLINMNSIQTAISSINERINNIEKAK